VVTLEDSGIPTANVATTEFMGAAQAQCSALGLPQYKPIFVAHPIQPKTPEEVRVLVDQVIDQIVGKLLKQKVRQAA
jgi:hypothetical protein